MSFFFHLGLRTSQTSCIYCIDIFYSLIVGQKLQLFTSRKIHKIAGVGIMAA